MIPFFVKQNKFKDRSVLGIKIGNPGKKILATRFYSFICYNFSYFPNNKINDMIDYYSLETGPNEFSIEFF